MKTKNEICECGHHKNTHNIRKTQYRIIGCCVMNKDGSNKCPCKKFKPKETKE